MAPLTQRLLSVTTMIHHGAEKATRQVVEELELPCPLRLLRATAVRPQGQDDHHARPFFIGAIALSLNILRRRRVAAPTTALW
jgi:hypothetical protein